MKRFLSLILACCLALCLAVPALAEAPADMEAALQTAAAQVKETLEIDDDYTEFSGNWNDGLRPGWYLSWSDGARELSVTCDEDGLITEMYRWESTGREDYYSFRAAFPALDEAAARTQAEHWLERLMGAGETARIDGVGVGLTRDGEYSFWGAILLNGLESPVTFTMRIGAGGLMGYSRSDGYRPFVGGAPEETEPALASGEAGSLLAGTAAMELYYVSENGEARLRYVPVGPYTVVDALTGEAVDMDALYASFDSTASKNGEISRAEYAMAQDAAGAGKGLTEMELTSIANYREALDQEKLDAALRALPHMGLEAFSLDRCSYSLDGSTGELRAELRYTAMMDEEHLFGFSRTAYDDFMTWGDRPVVTKYFTLDAKTGELTALYTSYPLWEEDRTPLDPEQDAYEEFLQAAAPEKFAETKLCDLKGQTPGDGAFFARTHDGYFCPENYLYAALDPDGTVEEFRCVWDEEMTFAPSKDIVDEAAALKAYVDALDVTLGYVAWPEGIDYDDPVLYRYADWGYSYVESLRLAWYFGGTEKIAGVDALTGEILTEDPDGSYGYEDLAGEPLREEIETLGAAGIGFAGGSFLPGAALTMADAAALLLQASGYDISDWDEESLGREAVWSGFVPAGEWEPERELTGGDFLRMLLKPSRYGAAAELTGVWAPDYGDDGYAAVAAGLGMPSAPDGVCTRAEAADLLYGFMSRT